MSQTQVPVPALARGQAGHEGQSDLPEKSDTEEDSSRKAIGVM